jgi:hypothetical protein
MPSWLDVQARKPNLSWEATILEKPPALLKTSTLHKLNSDPRYPSSMPVASKELFVGSAKNRLGIHHRSQGCSVNTRPRSNPSFNPCCDFAAWGCFYWDPKRPVASMASSPKRFLLYFQQLHGYFHQRPMMRRYRGRC